MFVNTLPESDPEPEPHDIIWNYSAGNSGWEVNGAQQTPNLTIAKDNYEILGSSVEAFHMTSVSATNWGQNNTVSIDVTGKGENKYLVFDVYAATAQPNRSGALVEVVGVNGYFEKDAMTGAPVKDIAFMVEHNGVANVNSNGCWATAGAWTTVYIDLTATGIIDLDGYGTGVESVLVGLAWGNTPVDTYIANIHFANELPA